MYNLACRENAAHAHAKYKDAKTIIWHAYQTHGMPRRKQTKRKKKQKKETVANYKQVVVGGNTLLKHLKALHSLTVSRDNVDIPTIFIYVSIQLRCLKS